MKTIFLLAAGLACATTSHAQTTPPAPGTGTNAPVSGTKNVGADRADAPKAPGMSAPTPQRPARAPRPARRGPAARVKPAGTAQAQ